MPPVPLFPESLHNKKVCAIVWVWTGAEDELDEALAPARALEPLLDGVGPIPLPALNSLFDPLYPAGMPQYWRADFIEEFTEDAIAKYAEVAPTLPTPMTQIHLFSINGAASRVPMPRTFSSCSRFVRTASACSQKSCWSACNWRRMVSPAARAGRGASGNTRSCPQR